MMINGTCNSGTWGSLGNFDVWGAIGLIFDLVFLVGLIAGITLLIVWAVRRARVLSNRVQPKTGGHNPAKETLQARYARGEITREQYELKKQVIG